MKRICGLDISTATIGVSIIETDDDYNFPKLIHISYIKPPKKGSIFERIAKTQALINDMLTKFSPDLLSIESIVQFMAGASGAKTIIALARMNISVGMICYQFLKRSPSMFNVMSIRHGIKLSKELPKKEEIPELVSKHLGITFSYVLDKNSDLMTENYDMADAVAVGLYTITRIKQLEQILSKPKPVISSKKTATATKRLKASNKKHKECLLEYKEITGHEYNRSI